jgi:hypothetical protein
MAKQSSSSTRQAILDQSAAWLGVPYHWGGASPSTGFDCSGYTRAVYKAAAGISLPHLAAAQAVMGKKVSPGAAQPGDLVFFGHGGVASHCGIYIAKGKIRHAPHTGAVVRDESISTIGVPLMSYRNLLKDGTSSPTTTTGGGSKLSYADVFALARSAGLGSADATTATAIAAAESGLKPGAIGDVGLEDGTWGPSVGLWQIRSLKAQQGSGNTRDASRLTDPVFNAHSMASISGGGASFTPWSTYTSGAYRQYMQDARNASSSAAPTKARLASLNQNYSAGTQTSSGGADGTSDVGFFSHLDPFNWFGGITSDIEKTVMGGVLYASLLGLGVGLVIVGLAVSAMDHTNSAAAPMAALPSGGSGSGSLPPIPIE